MAQVDEFESEVGCNTPRPNWRDGASLNRCSGSSQSSRHLRTASGWPSGSSTAVAVALCFSVSTEAAAVQLHSGLAPRLDVPATGGGDVDGSSRQDPVEPGAGGVDRLAPTPPSTWAVNDTCRRGPLTFQVTRSSAAPQVPVMQSTLINCAPQARWTAPTNLEVSRVPRTLLLHSRGPGPATFAHRLRHLFYAGSATQPRVTHASGGPHIS